jgi:dTDP-4-dehydrorhamnose reductase
MIRPESKVLITGCGGMLGEAVYATFSPKCTVRATDIDLNEPWLTKLDVRDKAAVTALCEEFKPDYIVHLAALTDMEQCEREFENSYRTNTEAVQFVAHEAQMRGIPLVYISTAGIFDGAKDIYDEDDAPNPLSIYGRTKYLGELIAKTVPQHIVVRAGWMMGGGPKKDKKFIGKLFKQIRDGKKEFYAVTDKMGSPCYTWDLARSLFFLLDGGHSGVFHGACDGVASRADVARELFKKIGRADLVLHEVTSDYFSKDYGASRPASEAFRNNRLKALNPSLTRDWQTCVADYVKAYDWNG